MKAIGNTPRTHVVVFWDKETKPLRVTSAQAQTLSGFLKDRESTFIDLYDENGDLVDLFNKRAIKSIEKVKNTGKTNMKGNLGYWCSYCTPHFLKEECSCKKKYGVDFMEVWNFFKKTFFGGKEFLYPKQVTKEMRVKALEFFQKKV